MCRGYHDCAFSQQPDEGCRPYDRRAANRCSVQVSGSRFRKIFSFPWMRMLNRLHHLDGGTVFSLRRPPETSRERNSWTRPSGKSTPKTWLLSSRATSTSVPGNKANTTTVRAFRTLLSGCLQLFQQSLGFSEPRPLPALEISRQRRLLGKDALRPLAGFSVTALRGQETRIV